jgi:hypothetical protein
MEPFGLADPSDWRSGQISAIRGGLIRLIFICESSHLMRLAFVPYGREPQLLLARKSRRAAVVSHLEEPGSSNVIALGVEIEKATTAAIAKAFLAVSSWV